MEKYTIITPTAFDARHYNAIVGLRKEAQEKLTKLKPRSIGQASRISGVSPADVGVLLIYLSTYKK